MERDPRLVDLSKRLDGTDWLNVQGGDRLIIKLMLDENAKIIEAVNEMWQVLKLSK